MQVQQEHACTLQEPPAPAPHKQLCERLYSYAPWLHSYAPAHSSFTAKQPRCSSSHTATHTAPQPPSPPGGAAAPPEQLHAEDGVWRAGPRGLGHPQPRLYDSQHLLLAVRRRAGAAAGAQVVPAVLSQGTARAALPSGAGQGCMPQQWWRHSAGHGPATGARAPLTCPARYDQACMSQQQLHHIAGMGIHAVDAVGMLSCGRCPPVTC